MDSAKNWNIFKNLILYTFVLLVGYVLWQVQSILILFFAAFILACAIDPMVEFISKKIPRKFALIIVLILLLLTIVLFFIPFVNIFIRQIIQFLNKIPGYWEQIESYLQIVYAQVELVGITGVAESLGVSKWISSIQEFGVLPDVSRIMSFASSMGQGIVAGSIGLTKNFLTGIAFLLTMTIIMVYMLMDKIYLKNKLMKLFPPEMKEKAIHILSEISRKVGGYVVSQIVIVFTLGVLLTIGLSLVKVEFALILASLAAVLELIPVVGPLIAAITTILVSFAQKPILALWAILVYWVTEWIVDTFVRPIVMGKFLNIHPIGLIFSLFVGAMLFGVPGLILAPAVAAIISVLIDELYVKEINPPEEEPEVKSIIEEKHKKKEEKTDET